MNSKELLQNKFLLGLQVAGLAILPLSFPIPEYKYLLHLLGWLLLFVGLASSKKIGKPQSHKVWLFGLFLLLSSATLAYLIGVSEGTSSHISLYWLLAAYLGAITSVLIKKSEPQDSNIVAFSLSITASLLSVELIVYAFVNKSFTFELIQQSLFTEFYLQTAFYISLGLLSMVFLLFSPKTQPTMLPLLFLGIFICTISIISLGSRNALAMLLSGCLLLLITRWKQLRITLRLLLISLFSGWLVIYFSDLGSFLRSRFLSNQVENLNSIRRLQFQELAKNTVFSNPLGLGWDSFSKISSGSVYEVVRSAHSLYFGVSISIGVIGALIYLLIIGTPALKINTTRREANQNMLISLLSACLLIQGINDDITVVPIGFIYLLVLFSYFRRPEYKE